MKTFSIASGMKLNNILPLILIISGHFCVNATETISSDVDGKSQEESKRDPKSNYLFLKGFHFPLLSHTILPSIFNDRLSFAIAHTTGSIYLNLIRYIRETKIYSNVILITF